MAYATYTTDALVCGMWKRNTADGSFLLLTREAGMLYADARSVREERSKQRYALQDFSAVRVSLVKGKRGWKVGSVEPHRNYFLDATSKEARGSVVTLLRFVRRFLGSEEAVPELYDYLTAALTLLSKDIPERNFLERVVQTRLLFFLGYVDEKKAPPFIYGNDLSDLVKDASEASATELEKLIDKAISTSHL